MKNLLQISLASAVIILLLIITIPKSLMQENSTRKFFLENSEKITMILVSYIAGFGSGFMHGKKD